MLFNSFGFIFLFLPAAVIGFFAVSRLGKRYGVAWLMLTSILFYGVWNPRFVLLLLLSIAFNFTMGELIHTARDRPARQKILLALGVGCDILALGYYKYFYSLFGFLDSVGGAHIHLAPIVLPLGISFFTFTQIGYLADMQQGVAKERGLLNYILFVTFFPHLIAGPILHNREIMPQFANPETYRPSAENFTSGLVIFVIGLTKKCVLADPIAARVQAGFAAPQHLHFFAAWLTVLTYSLQLYFDFSGYSDMAIGIARMFNIRFPINFNSPFKATSIIDYWHRWHITLSRFLNLYLFNPLAFAIARHRAARGKAVNRAAQQRPAGFSVMVALPLLTTMGLAGIWHGAGIQFLIFGLLHGIYLTINHAWRMAYPPGKHEPTRLAIVGSFLLTLAAVLVALVFFRAPTLPSAIAMLGGMAGIHGFDSLSVPTAALAQFGVLHAEGVADNIAFAKTLNSLVKNCIGDAWIIVLCAIVWAFPNTQEIMSRYELPAGAAPRVFLTWRPTLGWATALGAMGAVALLAIGGTREFLYYQF